MLSDLYFRRKLGVPYLSLIILTSCLIVTISIKIFPELAQVLGGYKPFNYPWQYFTLVFNHGSDNLSSFLHLFSNSMVILIFGTLTERVLGTKKFFVFTLTSALLFYLETHLVFNDWAGMNGISGIVWGYSVFVLYVLVILIKNHENKLLRDPMFYITISSLFVIWIVITIVDYYMLGKISYGLIAHIISILIGLLFVFIWRDYIKNRIISICNNNISRKNIALDKKIIISSLVIPIFIILILVLSFTGILYKHKIPINSIIPKSGNITELNNYSRQIRINFDFPMEKEVQKSSLYTTSKEYHSLKLLMDVTWLDDKNLLIKFSRDIYKDEKIKVVLSGFTKKTGNIFNDKIILQYG